MDDPTVLAHLKTQGRLRWMPLTFSPAALCCFALTWMAVATPSQQVRNWVGLLVPSHESRELWMGLKVPKFIGAPYSNHA